ncbi:MAG: protein kinase [Anaerolineae bacterium]
MSNIPGGPSGPTILDGRYQLQQQIGVGGSSVVYRALDQRLGRTVAVKLLRPHLAQDPAYLQRFQEEARRAAQVSYPYMAAVLDLSADPAHPYIVMEYVDGQPLNRLAPLPIADAVEYTRQAGEGLAFLHSQQLVHGDVKPENILVGKDGRVKLVDLGIASPPGAQAGATIMGSPAYVAPERLQGAPLSTRADVYGLGATLFEALTGRPPFVGATAQDVAAQNLSSNPPDLLSLRPDAPTALAAIVSRALAKDPAQRYPDMASLNKGLASLQMSAGQTTGPLPRAAAPAAAATAATVASAPPPSAPPPNYPPPRTPATAPAPPPRRNRGLGWAGLLALLAILCLALAGFMFIQQNLASRLSPVAAPPSPTLAVPSATTAPGKPSATPQPAKPTATEKPQPTDKPTATDTPPKPTATEKPTFTAIPPTATKPATTPSPAAATAAATQAVVEVPRVLGLTQKAANVAIEAAGLRVGNIDFVATNDVPPDTVVGQQPAPGTRAPAGSRVNYVLAEKPSGAPAVFIWPFPQFDIPSSLQAPPAPGDQGEPAAPAQKSKPGRRVGHP